MLKTLIRFLRYSSIGVLCLALFCGCSQSVRQTITINPSAQGVIYETDSTEHKAQLTNLKIAIPEGWEFGSASSFGHFIYYELCEIDPLTGNYLKSTLFQLNYKTNKTTRIIEIQNDGNTFFTNEMVCMENAIFWVYRDASEQRIEKFSLDTQIKTSLFTTPPESIDLIVCGDDQYLTWYYYDGDTLCLLAYDIIADTTSFLSKTITTDSPYTRAYVNDHITAFLESNGTNQILVVYDLATQERTSEWILPKDFLITRVQANQEYVVCTDGYNQDSSLYSLNIKSGQFVPLHFSGHGVNLFSCHLFDQFVIINSNRNKELIVLSLANHTFSPRSTQYSLVMGSVSPSGIYSAYDLKENTIVFLNLLA